MIFGANIALSPQEQKLRELALYVSNKCKSDPSFGVTKLNKLLFFADFVAYLNFGTAITGVEYFRLPKGPAPRRWVPVRDQMIKDRDLVIEKNQFHGFPQQRPIALREPELSGFTGREIDLTDRVIELHRNKTASEISDESHGFIGWKLAQDRETIPYSVVRVRKRPLTSEEAKYASTLADVAQKLVPANAD